MPVPTAVRTSNFALQTGTTRPITATIDYSANQLVVIHGITEDSTITLTTPTGGTGLTLTLQQSTTTANKTRHYLWTAVAASSQTAQTITTTISSAVGTGGLIVEAWPVGSTLGATTTPASATTGVPSVAITTTAAGSSVSWESGDWAAISGDPTDTPAGSRTRLTVNASTGTETLYSRVSGQATFYGAYYADVGAAGAKTVGLSAPTGQNWFIIAAEIVAAAGGATISARVMMAPNQGAY